MAAAALLSSCENLEPQVSENFKDATQNVVSGGTSSEGSVVFTANIATDTKTYMDYDAAIGQYKLLWDENDQIFIFDYESTYNNDTYFERCLLAAGAGTTSATFTGSLVANKYIAVYGGFTTDGVLYFPDSGHPIIALPDIQYNSYRYGETEGNIANDYYAMVAVSESTTFDFENVFSVLKLSVTGNGEYLDSIRVEANDPSLQVSGLFEVTLDGDDALTVPLGNTYSDHAAKPYVTYFPNCYIDSDARDFYITLPAQTYPGGIKVTLYTAHSHMDLSTTDNLVLEQSKMHAVPAIEYEAEYQVEDAWAMIGTMTEWSSDIEMTKADGYGWLLENQYLEEGDEFKFRANGEWLLEFGYYNLSILYTEEGVEWFEWFGEGTDYNGNLRALQSGYYDLLLNPDNATLYVDLVGVEESFYGTIEEATK